MERRVNTDLKNYVVLYREPMQPALSEPLAFQCWAENTDHAEEQCENAYPDCGIVWVWQGEHGAGVQPALADYYAGGEV